MGKKILVVDDDELVLMALEELLSPCRYDVSTASRGKEALAKLDQGGFALMILDVLMPVQTGYDVLELLKANHPDMPVLLVSGKVDPLTRDALDKLGAEDFLEKPVGPDTLVETVQRIIGEP